MKTFFEVEIPADLQITRHGLSLAMRRIPYEERRALGDRVKWWWKSVRIEDGRRIATIAAEKQQ